MVGFDFDLLINFSDFYQVSTEFISWTLFGSLQMQVWSATESTRTLSLAEAVAWHT